MKTPAPHITDVNSYITTFPISTQKKLQQIRSIIHKAAPTAEEVISYQMPTFKLNGNLVHFAGYKNHIGFYPAPSAIEQFNAEISGYVWAKGSIQFPLDQPLPAELIKKIVQFRVSENELKARSKAHTKTCPNGHTFLKSSDCPTCPICERERKPDSGFLAKLGAPARRALEREGIDTLKKLSHYREAEILQLHGVGPSSLPKLNAALKSEGLQFKA